MVLIINYSPTYMGYNLLRYAYITESIVMSDHTKYLYMPCQLLGTLHVVTHFSLDAFLT